MSTEELKPASAWPEPERTRFGRRWRGLTGSLAAGMVVLAAAVAGAGVISAVVGIPGPGTASVMGHVLAAIVALVAQGQADRRAGRPAAVAGIAVLAVAVFVLVFFWWWP